MAARPNNTLQSRTKHIHVSHKDKVRNIILDANFDLHAHFQTIMSHTQKIVCSVCECTYINISKFLEVSEFETMYKVRFIKIIMSFISSTS